MRETDESGHPTPESFRCEWVDYHPDMYPEFAPEPLQVSCLDNADVVVVYFDEESPPFERAMPGAMQLCRKHAALWLAETDEDRPSVVTAVDREGNVVQARPRSLAVEPTFRVVETEVPSHR